MRDSRLVNLDLELRRQAHLLDPFCGSEGLSGDDNEVTVERGDTVGDEWRTQIPNVSD